MESMKKIVCIVVLCSFLAACSKETVSRIPLDTMDDNFAAYLLENFDLNRDGFISEEEAALVKEIDTYGLIISSLDGIQYFPNLEILNCSYKNLGTIDVSNNTALKYLDCSGNQLANVDVSKNSVLETLISEFNPVVELKTNTELRKLILMGHMMNSLNFSGHKSLREIYCFGYECITIDISHTLLDTFICTNYGLAMLNLDGCSSMKKLDFGGQGMTVDLGHCPNLEYLTVYGLRNLDVSHCPLLKSLNITYSILPDLDLHNNSALEELIIDDRTSVTNGIDVSNKLRLVTLKAHSIVNNNLDLSNHQFLESVDISAPDGFESLNFSGCTSLKDLHIWGGAAKSLNVKGCITLSTLNYKGSGLTELDVEGLASLSELDCFYNNLSKLNLKGCVALSILNCSNNQLIELDIEDCTNLTDLNVAFNRLTSLKTNSEQLSVVNCGNNPLIEMEFQNNSRLKELNCEYMNSMSSLEMPNSPSLEKLVCSNNKFETLDVSKCPNLIYLTCRNNLLQPKLDVSKCRSLSELDCEYNPELTELVLYRHHVISTLRKDAQTQIILSD